MAQSTKISLIIASVLCFCISCQKSNQSLHQKLSVPFAGRPSQIEIGGPFVGIEMHTSSPLLNRISFYYPVANSIDLSTDYWKRERDRILSLGIKFGDRPMEWLQPEPMDYELTPYSVVFTKSDDEKTIRISYEFCKTKPAFVAKIEITNNLPVPGTIDLVIHLATALRTSHSYKLKATARSEFDSTGSTLYTHFDDPETDHVQIFIANAGDQPTSYSTQPNPNDPMTQSPNYPITELPNYPIAQFTYSNTVPPNQRLKIIQLIGSCQQNEGREIVKYLLDNYERETSDYRNDVLKKAFQEGSIRTNDPVIDHSAHWAKAILATNIHYLDGELLPMPCPAEYNFYFTHDVQLTDLARVNFDLARVKKDLEFIIRHATADHIIPHAYYWRDDRYVTEYATPDNWNHFWFILLSASYLRHSGDSSMLEHLYPLVETSLKQVLQNKKDDGLVYAYRPDWWDIGRSYGPRAYMTILTIRALREFVFLTSALNKNLADLPEYEKLADDMQQQLTARLWDDELKFLINYFEDGSKDTHFYIGALLAAHFDLLDQTKKVALMETARLRLLDETIGIYNVYPMDFHQLIDYLKLAGNEAGDPYCYANGGIWPHGNAWYALGLISIGQKSEAYRFIKNIMTIDGIINSPNGQPAMYEYRNSNKHDPAVYGKIDKPQFMWAGGWYLYCLYHLLGLRENEWNISFDPCLIDGQPATQFDVLIHGKKLRVTINGQGDQVRRITLGGKDYPSLVLPESIASDQVDLILGKPEAPYVLRTNSILKDCRFESQDTKLTMKLKAFAGHRYETVIISPWQPSSITLNGDHKIQDWDCSMEAGSYVIRIRFSQPSAENFIEIQF